MSHVPTPPPAKVYKKVADYLSARDAYHREAGKDLSLLDTFAADAILDKGRGPFDATSIPDLPKLPNHLYDFVFYMLLHPEASTGDLKEEFKVGDTIIGVWRRDPRVIAHLAQMRSEVRSMNMAQISLLERAARNKAIEILNMPTTSKSIEEQGKMIRFVLDLSAKMRGIQDGPLVNVNVGFGGVDQASIPSQEAVDRVVHLAGEIRAQKRMLSAMGIQGSRGEIEDAERGD